jgi:serpin B
MTKRIALVLAAATLVGACGSSTVVKTSSEARSSLAREAASPSAAQSAASAVDAFAFDLLRTQTGTTKGNVALSPWSIATALAMTRVGAAGQTATEMDRVLHVGDPASADAGMNSLSQAIASRNVASTAGDTTPLAVDISSANRVFSQQGFHLQPAFLDELARSYGGSVGLVDFAKTEGARAAINTWVAAHTRDRIKELIASGVLDGQTRLVLVNAVYLQADWATPFANDATRPATFHAPGRDVTTPFMNGASSRPFASGDGWQSVDLDYAGGSLTLSVVVPDAGRFDDVAARLDTGLLAKVAAATVTEVDLSLPKFAIQKATDLAAVLSALGMPTAFTDQADFSAMTGKKDLLIGHVVHQATVAVDEKGTVAAAATAVIMQPTAAPVKVQQLTVDRPFLFLLRDKPTGAIVFAGQVTDPSAS